METNPASWSCGRLIAVISAGLVLLILIGIGVYGLIASPQRPAHPIPEQTPQSPRRERPVRARHG